MSIFGVDSKYAADTRLSNGYRLYDWVIRTNEFPEFWGRSISGEHQVTKEEIEFLHAHNCKLLLLFDDLTEEGVSKTNGAEDAVRAMAAAEKLGVPSGQEIAIIADIDGEWSINHNWMLSFAYTLRANGYVPGFMGNTDCVINSNFDHQCSHFAMFAGEQNNYHAIFGATEPKVEDEPEEWKPYCPSAFTPNNMGLWRCGSVDMLDTHYANATYARDNLLLKYMW